jgi:hypothetical protein
VTTPIELCQGVLDAMSAALTEAGSPPASEVLVVGQVAFDLPCGQLSVGIERTYRSVQFPLESSTDDVAEWGGQIAVVVLVTLTGCMPGPTASGDPPSPAAVSEASSRIYCDAATIWQVATSPMLDEEWERALVSQTYVNGGDAVGVETRFTLGLAIEQWCP